MYLPILQQFLSNHRMVSGRFAENFGLHYDNSAQDFRRNVLSMNRVSGKRTVTQSHKSIEIKKTILIKIIMIIIMIIYISYGHAFNS